MSFGPIIEEVQTHTYMNNKMCAKARQLLLIVWLLSAFTLTISYKEVLIANLVNVEYEQSVDNFDDLVESGMEMCVPENTLIPHLLFNDPRESTKAMLDKIVSINFTLSLPTWIQNG